MILGNDIRKSAAFDIHNGLTHHTKYSGKKDVHCCTYVNLCYNGHVKRERVQNFAGAAFLSSFPASYVELKLKDELKAGGCGDNQEAVQYAVI